MYDANLLETVLSEAFGTDDRMMGPRKDSPMVAVTASTGHIPPCNIFSTYNKSEHPTEAAYGWSEMDVLKEIRVWEA